MVIRLKFTASEAQMLLQTITTFCDVPFSSREQKPCLSDARIEQMRQRLRAARQRAEPGKHAVVALNKTELTAMAQMLHAVLAEFSGRGELHTYLGFWPEEVAPLKDMLTSAFHRGAVRDQGKRLNSPVFQMK